jgi:RNA polymerase-associated protein CTR9
MASQGLNGLNGHHDDGKRFSYIPPAIDIPLGEGEEVEVNLSELLEDPTELCTLLENEGVAKGYWEITALAYAKENKMDHAIDIIKKGLGAFSSGNPQDRLSLLSALCWMYLFKCRNAPRIPEGSGLIEASAFYPSAAQLALTNGADEQSQTKNYWLQEATRTLNDASRISPSYNPLLLARGVLSLLRSSMQHPDDRAESLKTALKSFDDALRASHGLNIMAMMGRARVLYSQGKYPDAHSTFQQVLQRAPHMSDPDPRIGLGCCLWQMGHVEDAKNAWERALEVNPDSKQAYLLLGLYWLNASSKLATKDPKFRTTYTKGIQDYVQKSFKIDKDYPLTNATFANYYSSVGRPEVVTKLARKVIERSDVSTIASDGWYLLARVSHNEGETTRAFEYYSRADQARGGDGRGGDDRGHLPSKFGMAQIKVLQEDFVDAKFRLEKINRVSRSTETMSLLGMLYADDYFTAPEPNANTKDDERTDAWKKAVGFLENVRMAWKDPKKNLTTNTDVLLTLARLYETDSPDKSLQCLQQVEKEELGTKFGFEEEKDTKDKKDEKKELTAEEKKTAEAKETAEKEAAEAKRRERREQLPPQLLNNMGCLHFQAESLSVARDDFQTALNACVRVASEDTDADTDALVSTISYNLARCYEAENMNDEAKKVYEGLLERHTGYIDASARLAYITLRENPKGEGAKAMSKVYHSAEDNLDIRGLYGWYLNKTRKPQRNATFAEDLEQRHLKHTLRDFNKHDHYSLTAMGNLHLIYAREMPRMSESDKQKRKKMYEKAVEFFTKALELDPKNAYAVQGLAIAIVEDKKDMSQGIQLLSQVREVLKDPSVYINLGHAFCELKQYSRAIENVSVYSSLQHHETNVYIVRVSSNQRPNQRCQCSRMPRSHMVTTRQG